MKVFAGNNSLQEKPAILFKGGDRKIMFFGSDNQTGASLPVLEMIKNANTGCTHGYGDDKWTEKAVDKLKNVLEYDLEAYFVATGTASNALALSCLAQPWEAILCHQYAHILVDESTAPEYFTGGARLIPVSQGADKLTAQHLEDYFRKAGKELPHNPLAKALSITQASEAGLVYKPHEIKALTDVAKDEGLWVHMDGARFANALASLRCTSAELSWKSGVDVLCLGATKCGALCAEAVIFFNKELAKTFIHRRKRSGHLISKGRMFGAQFIGWLQNDHWLELAEHANYQAAQLAEAISSLTICRLYGLSVQTSFSSLCHVILPTTCGRLVPNSTSGILTHYRRLFNCTMMKRLYGWSLHF